MKTAIEEVKPDAFIWLGDNPSHFIWNQTKDNHLDAIKHISKLFMEHPGDGYKTVGKMYPILGNHEGLPCDVFDLEGDTHKWVIDGTAALWKQWLTPESYESYLKLGSYTQLHPGTRLRIIALNDFVHDIMNSHIWKNQTNPLGLVSCLAFSHSVVVGLAGTASGQERARRRVSPYPHPHADERSDDS